MTDKPVVGSSKEWVYCPECGSDEIHYEEGRHKQCAECHQEWFSDIDYTNVVRANLNDMKKRLAPETSEQPQPKRYSCHQGSYGEPSPMYEDSDGEWMRYAEAPHTQKATAQTGVDSRDVLIAALTKWADDWAVVRPGEGPLDKGWRFAAEEVKAIVAKSANAQKAAARQLCTQCTGWLDEHRHWCPSLLKPQCPWCGGEHVGTDCKAEKASAETKV